jgi:hypothetical protein
MKNRLPITKTVRFEVFKRDKFVCQYCGDHAPNVILEVDHIDPVSKGGGNEILNLITSCFGCNRGKKNVKLNDDSILNKQRNQIEMLQERREQIELMFQWKNDLSKLDDDLMEMLSDYLNSKIDNFSLSETGLKTIKNLTKKFELADILEATDISANKYLEHDSEGNLIKDSVENFINKIGGILTNKNRSIIDQKKSYIKGICRNSFNYFDERKASIILNYYVSALKNHGWSEDAVVQDLENEVMPKTKECANWSQWKNLLEKWTDDIGKWEQNETAEINEITEDTLNRYAQYLYEAKKMVLLVLNFMGKEFDNFDQSKIENLLTSYIDSLIKNLIDKSIFTPKEFKRFEYDHENGESGLERVLYHSGIMELFEIGNKKDKFNDLQKGLHTITPAI